MTEGPFRLAVAARFADRHDIRHFLTVAQLTQLPAQITATWLTVTAKQDADLTDAQAEHAAMINRQEIRRAHLLLYFPCWGRNSGPSPLWTPGRLIDVGLAMACSVPVLVVGIREPSMYFRGAQVSVCERTPMALYRAVKERVR